MRLACLAMTILMLGCGAADPGTGARVSAPFEARHARFFDDSVDVVENPQDLGGRWQEEWEKDLDGRVAEADLIVTGRVSTLRTDQDLQQRSTLHLVLQIDERLEGEYKPAEVSVRVSEGAPGYANVERYRDQILDHTFVLFVRWYRDENGKVSAHFHLSPPSPYLTRRVDEQLAQRRPSTVRIIQRSN